MKLMIHLGFFGLFSLLAMSQVSFACPPHSYPCNGSCIYSIPGYECSLTTNPEYEACIRKCNELLTPAAVTACSASCPEH